jgi:hypothetical protein
MFESSGGQGLFVTLSLVCRKQQWLFTFVPIEELPHDIQNFTLVGRLASAYFGPSRAGA